MVKKDYGFAFTKIINSKTRKPINKNIDLDLDIREVENWLGERGIDYLDKWDGTIVSEKSRFALACDHLFVEWYELISCKEECYCTHCTTDKPWYVMAYNLKNMYGEVTEDWKADGFEWTKKSILEIVKDLQTWDVEDDDND